MRDENPCRSQLIANSNAVCVAPPFPTTQFPDNWTAHQQKNKKDPMFSWIMPFIVG